MAKPIFIIRTPFTDIEYDFKDVVNDLKDYHILIINEDRQDIFFQCYYEKDFNEIKFEELKEIVKSKLK